MGLQRCLLMALGFQTLDLLMDFQTKTCRMCSRTQQLRLWSVELYRSTNRLQLNESMGDTEQRSLSFRDGKKALTFFFSCSCPAPNHVHKFDLRTPGPGSSMEGLVHACKGTFLQHIDGNTLHPKDSSVQGPPCASTR
jgi:hypothetical protein